MSSNNYDIRGSRLYHSGYEFELATHTGQRSEQGPLTLKKPTWMIERYCHIAERFNAPRIVELGLWEGGSTAFLALAFKPSRLLGFELHPEPLPLLERFLDEAGLTDSVHSCVGVDQADTAAIGLFIEQHSGDAPLDLVVDDASHLPGPTRTSFEYLFPRLREGGCYIIEDWSHEHQFSAALAQRIDAGEISLSEEQILTGTDRTTLGQLLAELLILAGLGNGVITEVRARQGFAEIIRGPATLDANTFSVREAIGPLGRQIIPDS